MNRSVRIVGYAGSIMAHRTLEILQLNVYKRKEVQQSLLNDGGLKDYIALAISEPYARTIDGSVVTVPMGHHNWTTLRQGQGDLIINLMDEYSLVSLLLRGTKTWQLGDAESTIDLVLASAKLAD